MLLGGKERKIIFNFQEKENEIPETTQLTITGVLDYLTFNHAIQRTMIAVDVIDYAIILDPSITIDTFASCWNQIVTLHIESAVVVSITLV